MVSSYIIDDGAAAGPVQSSKKAYASRCHAAESDTRSPDIFTDAVAGLLGVERRHSEY